MNNEFLERKLQRVVRRYQWIALWRKLAALWALAALFTAGLVWLGRSVGWSSPSTMPVLSAVIAAVALGTMIWHFQHPPDLRWIVRRIEKAFPELQGVLLTAIQQRIEPGVEPGFLQYRLVQEATARSQEQDWRKVFPIQRLIFGQLPHLMALACLGYALSELRREVAPLRSEQGGQWVGGEGIQINPGDTTLERGDSLVVLAKFSRTLPASVSLVIQENGVAARSVPLVKSLSDPVFGGSVPEIANDLTYRLEYRGERTRDFKVTVFEHPKLLRADANLTFPNYTQLPPKRIEDTRRVSAVQGTKIDYALQLNKPVKSAQLVARDDKKVVVPLTAEPGKATALLAGFVPEKSRSYELQLVDADGRANKVATPFVIDVQPNRPPELRLASPRGDVRPSALEEVSFEGTVWDDFGSPAYGLAYAVAGGETKFLELGRGVGAKEKRTFAHTLRMEELGVKPDDLVSWFAWADDIGPDGQVRRTSSDLYFGEVRPFDEIFRESQDMQSSDQQQGMQAQGNQQRRLGELQKQIISATWKLQRGGTTPKYAEDLKVVTDSQAQALEQAEGMAEEARSPRDQAAWKEATTQMETALDRLKSATDDPKTLASALTAEQAAYQSLLKLQARETNVTRNQRRGGGGGGGGGNQRQIDQLDLKQAENRYETQRQAQAPQSQERREQLAVMNRLQELARRQQDLNERLKELQTALQEARTEQEREEVRKRLKRLEEEQRQMLADSDEVRQRMDRAENQANMSEQRRQLEETREDIQRAADAANQGSVAQALAAGTRAQRQLQQMRDELRKQNSSQFADDLREMRSEARELSKNQEEIGKELAALGQGLGQRKSLGETGEKQELLQNLERQKERMTQLMDKAQQISEQAENTEPLLSKQLYDSVRKVSQNDANSVKQTRQELLSSGAITRGLNDRLQQTLEREGSGKALEMTRDILKEGFVQQAGQASERARGEIDELRRGVERAAESVLGDETEQLKLAQSELDQLTDQLRREIAQATSQGGQQAGDEEGQGRRSKAGTSDQRQAGTPGDTREPGATPGESATGEPSANGEGGRGLARAERERNREGQPGAGAAGENRDSSASGDPAGQAGAAERAGAAGDGRGGRTGSAAERLAGNETGPRRGDRDSIENVMNRGGTAGGGNGGAWRDGAWNGGEWGRGGPLAGEDFARWSERLRDVETLLDAPDLRNQVATTLERARMLRRDLKLDQKKPDWTQVQLQILKPLVEVRSRVAEDLARRDSKDSLAPIDRDPVPNRFAESVRKYYEELGKDRVEAKR